MTDEVDRWLDRLAADDPDSHRQAVYAIEALAEGGPNLGRPLVDRAKLVGNFGDEQIKVG